MGSRNRHNAHRQQEIASRMWRHKHLDHIRDDLPWLVQNPCAKVSKLLTIITILIDKSRFREEFDR